MSMEEILSLINQGAFTKKSSSNQNATAKLSAQAKKMLDEFSENKEENKILMHKITGADEEGNLFVDLGTPEIKGVVPYLKVLGEPYDLGRRSGWVGTTNVMIVDSVDYDNGTVTFDMRAAKVQTKEAVRKYLIEELNKGRKPVINNCLVTGVGELHNRVHLSIGGVGIYGYVPVSEWEHGFIYNPEKNIDKFMSVTVQVERYLPQRPGKKGQLFNEAFICSRKAVLDDPWKGIEERYPVGTIFEVTCRATRQKSWFGYTDNLPMDVLCMYPNADKGIVIQPGKRYKVVITRVEEATKHLRAKVLSEIK